MSNQNEIAVVSQINKFVDLGLNSDAIVTIAVQQRLDQINELYTLAAAEQKKLTAAIDEKTANAKKLLLTVQQKVEESLPKPTSAEKTLKALGLVMKVVPRFVVSAGDYVVLTHDGPVNQPFSRDLKNTDGKFTLSLSYEVKVEKENSGPYSTKLENTVPVKLTEEQRVIKVDEIAEIERLYTEWVELADKREELNEYLRALKLEKVNIGETERRARATIAAQVLEQHAEGQAVLEALKNTATKGLPQIPKSLQSLGQ